jgi:hypothetical protein
LKQRIKSHQEVQVNAAEVGVTDIDFIHTSDHFNRFA